MGDITGDISTPTSEIRWLETKDEKGKIKLILQQRYLSYNGIRKWVNVPVVKPAKRKRI